MTCQPSASSCSPIRASRATFPLSFVSQKERRVDGIVAFRHPACWCQKHSCTKTTAWRAGITMSGLPGNSLRRNENRKPRRCNRERTSFSGSVSRLRIRLMFQLRCSGVMRSISMGAVGHVAHLLESALRAPSSKCDRPRVEALISSRFVLSTGRGRVPEDCAPKSQVSFLGVHHGIIPRESR